MFGRIVIVFMLLAAGALALGSAAYQEEVAEAVVESVPTLVAPRTATPLLSAVASYTVFDPSDGTILLSYNADQSFPIASITKLFAAMAIRDTFELDQSTTLEWSDLNAVGTAGRLQFGQEYTYRQLLFPLLLSSSNNAALTFERRAIKTGTPLPIVMEQLAVRSGYPDVQFADASGLSSGNQASASDLTGLITATREQYAYIYTIAGMNSYVGPYLGWQNNSPFVDDGTYLTGKHGFTNAAGRTAVALFSEEVDGVSVELGYVILGSADLVSDMQTLRKRTVNLVSWQ